MLISLAGSIAIWVLHLELRGSATDKQQEEREREKTLRKQPGDGPMHA